MDGSAVEGDSVFDYRKLSSFGDPLDGPRREHPGNEPGCGCGRVDLGAALQTMLAGFFGSCRLQHVIIACCMTTFVPKGPRIRLAGPE